MMGSDPGWERKEGEGTHQSSNALGVGSNIEMQKTIGLWVQWPLVYMYDSHTNFLIVFLI